MIPFKKSTVSVFLFLFACLVSGCELQKDIDLDLPAYRPELVAECYLVPGQPYRMTVFESTPYLDRPEPILVPDATVIISHNGQADTLVYKPFADPATGKVYTHSSPTIMRGQPGDVFTLSVTDTRGRQLTGRTTVMAPIRIDTLEPRFNSVDEALMLVKFQDPAGVQNFYRLTFHKKKLASRPDRDYYFTDELNDGKQMTIGTSYRYVPGDTLLISLYHMEEQHYTFLRSADDASSANGNPFGQPATIKSSVQGGIGIFTNLAASRDSIIIVK